MVTFLFVLMLAQQRGFSDADDRTREPLLAAFSGFVLLGTLLIVIDRSYPDLRSFDTLVAKADDASNKNSLPDINAAIGDKNAFIAALHDEDKRLHARAGLYSAIVNVEEELNPARPDLDLLKARFKELAAVGHEIQHEQGPKPVPAANVAGLGNLLYSEHLLAVES